MDGPRTASTRQALRQARLDDAADAEALCEAASRPTIRYVPTKTVDQQTAPMLAASRERLVRARVQLANKIARVAWT